VAWALDQLASGVDWGLLDARWDRPVLHGPVTAGGTHDRN
jgi:hypothetical protein